MMILMCVLLVNLIVSRVMSKSFFKKKYVSCNLITVLILIHVKADNEVPETKSLTNHQKFNNNLNYPQCQKMNESKEIMNMKLLDDFCILKQRWYTEIPETNDGTFNISETRREYNLEYIVLDTLEERLTTEAKSRFGDCLQRMRRLIRPYPKKCYTKLMRWHENRFKGFWSEVSGDIMYTFDFVLYDDILKERKENQFWYLILYLKTLATLVESPASLWFIPARMQLLQDQVTEIKSKYALLVIAQIAIALVKLLG